MFDSIKNLYSIITELDLSIDKKYYYERIVYLALYKIIFNQLELINARDYHPIFLIIPMGCLRELTNTLLSKFNNCNDIIIQEIEKEQNELIRKFDVYNNNNMTTITNQTEILTMQYIYKINIHVIKTRLIGNAVKLCTVFINILTVVIINPIQFGCLLYFIECVMTDMIESAITATDALNNEVNEIENNNNKIANDYISNRNIIYECMEENTYLEKIKTNIHNHYNIRKYICESYTINEIYAKFEIKYQQNILLLTWIIPKNLFLTWIYTDLKVLCYNLISALNAYNYYTNRYNLLKTDEQFANVNTCLPQKCVIDISLISKGILFKFNNLSYSYNGDILFKIEDGIIPSLKWITLKGESGSGKTTLCNLLLKTIYNENDGIIFLNEYNKYDYNSIRQYISNVKPNMDLFDKDIEFNLKFGVSDCNSDNVKQQIIYYLELFGLENIINRLDTNINELSTGEKQRIKIIRCILHDKPIWILDEMTANIDSECEHIIMKCLRKIQIEKKKSVIHISHNDDLISYSDYTICINNNRVAINKTIVM
jgi:putative ABC transport system ATP-binding protein